MPTLKPFELLFFCFHTLAPKKWARHCDTPIGRWLWANLSVASQVTMSRARSTVMVGWGFVIVAAGRVCRHELN